MHSKLTSHTLSDQLTDKVGLAGDFQVQQSRINPIKSEVLLAGTKELVIDHLGKLYKLRLTSLGKLILTT